MFHLYKTSHLKTSLYATCGRFLYRSDHKTSYTNEKVEQSVENEFENCIHTKKLYAYQKLFFHQ